MTTPHTLYSIFTDYGASAEGVIVEHFDSPHSRLEALEERAALLIGRALGHLSASELIYIIESTLGPDVRVILTTATRHGGHSWRTTDVDADYALPHPRR